jgi:cobalt-zinc-cadmium efflux system outer membrane protein
VTVCAFPGRWRRVRPLLPGVLLILGGTAGGEPAEVGLTLAEALLLAESRHPVLAAAPARRQAAEALVREARLKPAPELSLEVEDVLGTGSFRGLSAAEVTVGVSQLFEAAGLRDARVDVALADRDAAVSTLAVERLEVRAAIARRFVELLAEQQRLALRREAVALAADTVDEAGHRSESGRGLRADQARALIALELRRLEVAEAESRVRAARRQLAHAMGDLALDPGTAQGGLLPLPPALPLARLLDALEAAPEALRQAREIRLRESELRLAGLRRRPGLVLGTGLRRSEAEDDFGLVFSLSVPMGSAQRASPAIERAGAELRLSEAAGAAALLRARAEVEFLHEGLSHAAFELEILAGTLVPAAEDVLEDTRRLYSSGRYGLLELRDAQREWLEQRERQFDVAAAYHAQLIELQRLTGAAASNAPALEALP